MRNVARFSCPMDLPVLVGEDCKYVPVMAVFRFMPSEDIDEWLMLDGRPRSDRDLAAEILVEVRGMPRAGGLRWGQSFDVTEILGLERAAALVVSVFLSELPRPEVPAPAEARSGNRSGRSSRIGLRGASMS